MISNELEARAWLETLPEWDKMARERMEMLVALLCEEAVRQNLVSAMSLSQVWQRHVVDSAQLLLDVPRETSGNWLDLGTGAGFPGLVIGILRPELALTMVESRPLRTDWLERARVALALERATVVTAKLETVPTRPFRVISARAFAPLPKLLDLSARFSTSDSLWRLPKGRSAQQELDQLSGWRHMFHVKPSLTDPEAGVIVGTLIGRKGGKA